MLLISLLLWQDMFGAILTLLQFCNMSISDNWFFYALILKYIGQQGNITTAGLILMLVGYRALHFTAFVSRRSRRVFTF